jgi:CII-binding regulator of phage lambda lysogenization HflD
MTERDEIIKELKHLVRYYAQAVHEFFEGAETELQESLETFHTCLEKNKNSLAEYKKMIELLVTAESGLKKRVEDLAYLRERMNELLKGLE